MMIVGDNSFVSWFGCILLENVIRADKLANDALL